MTLVALPMVMLLPGEGLARPIPDEISMLRSAPRSVHVDVGEFFFAPASIELRRGGTVVFDFVGQATHTATDGSGLELYDSGNVEPGGPSFEYTFPAAGVYPFVCTPHTGMGGRVSVPVRVIPRSGPRRTVFTVVWAASSASAGRVYDVQIRRPGSTWDSWRRGVSARIGTFVAHGGHGVYRFRARMRDPGLGASSRWSPASRIRVR